MNVPERQKRRGQLTYSK